MGSAAVTSMWVALAVALAAPQAVLEELTPTTIAQGTDSAITEPRQVVARTTDEWRALWSAHSSGALPSVDFSRAIVVGIFLGSRPTPGYRVTVVGATAKDATAVVRFVEDRPDQDAILPQVLTTPFHLVTLPARVQSVTLQRVEPTR